MSGLLRLSGAVLGASLFGASVLHAECRPSAQCTDELCRTIIACANAERTQKTAPQVESTSPMPVVTARVTRTVPPATREPARLLPTAVAAAPSTAPRSTSVTRTREELRREILGGSRRH